MRIKPTKPENLTHTEAYICDKCVFNEQPFCHNLQQHASGCAVLDQRKNKAGIIK